VVRIFCCEYFWQRQRFHLFTWTNLEAKFRSIWETGYLHAECRGAEYAGNYFVPFVGSCSRSNLKSCKLKLESFHTVFVNKWCLWHTRYEAHTGVVFRADSINLGYGYISIGTGLFVVVLVLLVCISVHCVF
jgi:hypothetical protein